MIWGGWGVNCCLEVDHHDSDRRYKNTLFGFNVQNQANGLPKTFIDLTPTRKGLTIHLKLQKDH